MLESRSTCPADYASVQCDGLRQVTQENTFVAAADTAPFYRRLGFVESIGSRSMQLRKFRRHSLATGVTRYLSKRLARGPTTNNSQDKRSRILVLLGESKDRATFLHRLRSAWHSTDSACE